MSIKDELFAAVDFDQLVGFVANELDDGAVQALFTEAECEAGRHYDEAQSILETSSYAEIKKIVTEFKAVA